MADNQQNPGQDPLLQNAENIALSLAKIRREFVSSVESTRDLAKELDKSSAALKSSFESATSVKNALDDARNIAAKLGRDYIDQEAITDRINTNRIESAVIEGDIKAILESRNKQLSDMNDFYGDIQTRLTNSNEQIRDSVTAEEIAFKNLVVQLRTRQQINRILEDTNSNLDDGNVKVKEMQLKASVLARIFGSMTRIPFLKDFMDFKKISRDFDVSTRQGFATLGSEIMRVVRSPLFLLVAGITAVVSAFKALVKLAFDYDKIVTDIGNNLAVSRATSVDLLDTFRAISVEGSNLVGSLDKAFLSVKNQGQALLDLQESLGTNALFTNSTLQNQIFLTKQLKMSKEEAAGIQKFSLLTGRTAESILQSALKQNNTAISYRKVFSEIAKINAELSVAYKNNPDLIAQAVIQANKLGISLEQAQTISKGLLDFETSISGELESELLLGKQFNFEKARALALDGKSVEAANELLTQIGGINSLTQMNVIQRERLAASINLSAEALSNAAREQAVLTSLGFQDRKALEERYEILRLNNDQVGIARLQEEARRKEGGELLLQDIARANLQDRFNASVERLKETFTELSTSLIPVLEGIAKLLENTLLLKVVFASLAGLAAAIATSVVIATGGTAALAAGLVVGGGSLVAMSSLGGAGEASLPQISRGTASVNVGAAPTGNDEIANKLDKLIDVTEKKTASVYVDTVKSGMAYGMNATTYA